MPKGESFQASKSDRLLTIPDDINLPGDVRSRKRAEFDASIAQKELQNQVFSPSKNTHRLLSYAHTLWHCNVLGLCDNRAFSGEVLTVVSNPECP